MLVKTSDVTTQTQALIFRAPSSEIEMKTPREVVSAAFVALEARNYKGLAALCDPLSLRSFKQEMLDEYCPPEPPPDSEDHPVRRIELTDDQYEELIEFLDPVRRMKTEFPALDTIEQLQSMDPESLFATWMYSHSAERFDSKRKKRKPWEETVDWKDDDKDNDKDNDDETRREPKYAIIGCVFDSTDIAHVLYRNELSLMESCPDWYGEWVESISDAYRDFMHAMHHRGDPILITCRKQPDGSWLLVAKKHFMLFGSLSVSLVSNEDEE